MDEILFTVLTPNDEFEFETLPRAVKAAVDLGIARLSDDSNEQLILIDTTRTPILVRHVSHGVLFNQRVNEKPLLRLVANQVKRFTGKSVEIETSKRQKIVI